MNYFQFNIGDYMRDTAHLTNAEHGIYLLFLNRCYTTEKGIPDGQEHRLGRAVSPEEKSTVDNVLKEFFTLIDGFWINKRAMEEIEKFHQKGTVARENGKRGGRLRKEETTSETEEEKPTETHGVFLASEEKPKLKLTKEPITKNQEGIINNPTARAGARASAGFPDKIEHNLVSSAKNPKTNPSLTKPEEVSAASWEGFLQLRKAKRAPLSEAALSRIRTEASTAKITLEDALQICCAQGWQGFRADWYASRKPEGHAPRKSNFEPDFSTLDYT